MGILTVNPRYMGHLCGALAGLMVGLVALENRKVKNRIKIKIMI